MPEKIQDGPVALGAQPVSAEPTPQEAAQKAEEEHFKKAAHAIEKAVHNLQKALDEVADLQGFPFVTNVRSTVGFCMGALSTLEGIHLRDNEALAKRLGRVVR